MEVAEASLRKKVAEMVGKNRDRQTGEEVVSQALEGFQREFQIGGVLELELLAHVIYVRSGVVLRWVERFDRRGTEPFELFRSEFGQNSFKKLIQEFSLQNS